MNTSQILLAAVLAALSGAATADGADQRHAKRALHVNHAGPIGPVGPIGMHAFHMDAHARSIKNAPYSADAVTERTQVLADGNRITSRHSSMNYRDSQGRTRQEVRSADGELRSVIIHNQDGMLVLKPASKGGTLVRKDLPERARKAREEARARVKQLRSEGRLPAKNSAPDVHEEVVVRRVERTGHGEHASHVVTEDVQVRVREMHEKAGEMRGIAPIIVRAANERKYARDAKTTSLGTKEIGGVKAEGKLRSYEIPAGAIGNERPIVITDETWFAPELGLTVFSKHSDPRSGEHVYRLDNLRRTEPPADLFVAPAGYDIKDASARMRKHIDKAEKRIERRIERELERAEEAKKQP